MLLYGLRPIYNPKLSECEITEGVVWKLQEGVEFDLILRIQNHPEQLYYINRGLENNFKMVEVERDWKNRKSKIWYIERWPLKLLGNSTWHITRLDINGRTVYDETN